LILLATGTGILDISLTALSLVDHDASPLASRLEENLETSVRRFFVEHIVALIKKSQKTDSPPPGRFVDPEAQELFQSLHMGDATEFVGAAGVLTKRLIKRMNHTTKRGLLVCLRAESPTERIGAVLKLEVVASTGATLEELASGQVRLSAVTNIMDQPGELQKGALATSQMPAEEVLCGEAFNYQSRYFPEAFGIQVFARPSRGSSGLLNAVALSDRHLAPQIAEALPQMAPGSLRDVVSELGKHLPALDSETRTTVIDTLERGRLPITYVNTQENVTAMIDQGGMIIKGSAAVFHDAVQIRQNEEGGWEAVVRFDMEPKISYR
jgi:hypothetical protein